MSKGLSNYQIDDFFKEEENEDFILIYSFGLEGFKAFMVNKAQQIINALFYNFRKCESKSTQKLQLCVMKFCVET